MTISIFRDLVVYRRAAEHALRARRAGALQAGVYDQKPWSLMYKAITESIGADPKVFQLVYPFTSWNWGNENSGYISSAQYDFCSTVPQWSAIGSYASSGDRFNQAYQLFLDIIAPATDNAVLKQKIKNAEEELTDANNDLYRIKQQAALAYDDAGITDNDPSYTLWLETDGESWASQINAAKETSRQCQKNYNALLDQCNTPGLANAQAQFANEAFYSRLNDPGLTSYPKVPNWTTSTTSSQWVSRVKGGEGPAGGTFGFTNRDSNYDFSDTWAKGTLAVGEVFWSVQTKAGVERITEFETDKNLAVNISMKAMDTIQIQPSDWYNGPFVRSMANGQSFKFGYSPFGQNGQAVFGQQGFMNLLKTGMLVCYKPTFNITVSQATFQSFLTTFNQALSLRIGPFRFTAQGGALVAGWNASQQGLSFTGTSTSDEALIFGVNVANLPVSGA